MPAVQLDRDTADRMLRGLVHADDAPPGYADVARLVLALGAPPSPAELRRQDEAVVAAAARRTGAPAAPRPRGTRRSPLARAKAVGLLALGMLVATSGLAAAGALPDAAQNAVSDILSSVGISVPSADEDSNPARIRPERSPVAGGSALPRVAEADGSGTASHGNASRPGRNGGARGDAPSVASEPRSISGAHGGTGTADGASGGSSEHGTTIADERSDGRSSAGSGNAGNRPGNGPPPDRGNGAPNRGNGPPLDRGIGGGPPHAERP